MARVQIKNVSKAYPSKSKIAQTFAVDNASIDIAAGEIHAIIGYSGAGKSTLLRLINGLERASCGTIRVGDSGNIAELKEKELRKIRAQIGMVFQQFNLLHSRTVAQNIAYPLRFNTCNGARLNQQERRARVDELLEFVGLEEHANSYIEQLSGGQKQRVGIARALATNPAVLLADEATSALDPETSAEVLKLLQRINQEKGVTIILITHEMDVVREIAHRVTVMEGGKIVEQGEVFEVFANPKASVTKRFVATALPAFPDDTHLKQLREKHRGRIVTLTFSDESVYQPLVFQTLADKGVGINIVHGGVTQVGGRSFGKLTLELIGDEQRLAQAIAQLEKSAELEVLA